MKNNIFLYENNQYFKIGNLKIKAINAENSLKMSIHFSIKIKNRITNGSSCYTL